MVFNICTLYKRLILYLLFMKILSQTTPVAAIFVALFGTEHPTPENDKAKRWEYQQCYNCKGNADCCNNSGTIGTVSIISVITVAIRSFTMAIVVSIEIISVIHKFHPSF